uniref:Uncharacterized protein n=1 Tax=Candidatus Kentrum sp. DK TaxID=2126562 RepID=A0A450TG46_9GAMM|nr:MAG: hypothetical protein BECKDK2373C_GA0170839_11432 [Candidatus Kentron sp. DK]VFJ66260.1 MAG: hypothetical protein BECKDK2373B_GA0170837_11643 [Candidatus Kentron sp. DK]
MKSILTFIARFTLCAVLLHTTHAEELVGSLPGQLSVQQGAAVYTIPIEVPHGVAPNVIDTQPNHRPGWHEGWRVY